MRKKVQHETSTTATVSNRPADIIEAAYRCFQKNGIERTTIEDIARESEIPRPHIYRYFSGKEAIVQKISEMEMRKADEEVHRRIRRSGRFDQILTNTLLILTRFSQSNPFVRVSLESLRASLLWTSPGHPIHRLHSDRWRNLLEFATDSGEVAAQLSVDEIVSWLITAEIILISKVEAIEISDAELRRFIRNFIVRPILSNPPSAEARSLSDAGPTNAPAKSGPRTRRSAS